MIVRYSILHYFSFPSLKTNLRSMKTISWRKPEGYDTGIKIYNCVSKTKVPLILQKDTPASWYTCGPTVYDSTHIGHASCYIKLDIIQRILRDYFKIDLITAMNITDLDDKIIKKGLESEKDFQEISKTYENEFWNDINKLNIRKPDIKIRVTENIQDIIKFILKLLNEKQAYIGKDDSVYFQVNKYKNYGKLQFLNIEKSQTENSPKFENEDFALWKAQKVSSEPAWAVPWSNKSGRPGWHIECSALATKLFGNKIDFHAGGLDLKFPHHENEEAQSCCYHNTDQWVNYWLHTGHLNLKGQEQKMSKSLKNTIKVDELLQKYSADEFRMACVLSNYRNSMEFSDELMTLARTNINRFNSFLKDSQAYLDGMIDIGHAESGYILNKIYETKSLVDLALKDDFDTSKCIGYFNELIKDFNKILKSNNEIYTTSVMTEMASAKSFVEKFLNILGFNERIQKTQIDKIEPEIYMNDLIDKIIEVRCNIRQLAIQNKDQSLFKICDEIRKVLKSKNIEIKDHNKGTSWTKI